MHNLSNDLSTLAGANKSVFEKLIKNSIYCICDYLESAALNNESECVIDIGIGTLKLKFDDGSIRYYFIPSGELERGIISTMESQQNLLTTSVDAVLVNKLNNLYDSLL